MIIEKSGVTNASAFQQLNEEVKREVLRELKEHGASHRQLERLTGIGRGVIQKLLGDARDPSPWHPVARVPVARALEINGLYLIAKKWFNKITRNMASTDNTNAERCHSVLECLSFIIVFILVVGVILSSLYFMVFDLSRSKEVSRITIQVEAVDSLNLQQIYAAEGIDSLIAEVKRYENRLGEKYQYLIEQKEDDDRFKTWGALIVGVIVSVCSFWGYRSLKDLRSDVKKQTEVDTETKVNEYLNNNLDGLVRGLLTNALRGDVTDTIKTHVIETLNSDNETTISTRVKAVMESDKFDKQLDDIIKEKVIEVVEDMVLARQRELRGVEEEPSRGEENLTL